MAFNGFPATYQPMMYQPQVQQVQQPVQQVVQQPTQQPVQNNPMIWVQGETGAKSYLLAPNTTLPLWDSERQSIYLKSTDASGMPSMKILDYTIRDTTVNKAPISQESSSDFVTHEELSAVKDEIIREVKSYEQSNGNHSNGSKSKKQSNGDSK